MKAGADKIRFVERCYELYEQKMYRVAYNILHDVNAAEDAVQDAFVKLVRSKIVFDDAESIECKKYIMSDPADHIKDRTTVCFVSGDALPMKIFVSTNGETVSISPISMKIVASSISPDGNFEMSQSVLDSADRIVITYFDGSEYLVLDKTENAANFAYACSGLFEETYVIFNRLVDTGTILSITIDETDYCAQ